MRRARSIHHSGSGPQQYLWRLLQIHMQVRVRAAQPPETGGPPFGRDLKARGQAVQVVLELRREQRVWRWLVSFRKGKSGFDGWCSGYILAEQIVVAIEKSGNVHV